MAEHSDDADPFEYNDLGYTFEPAFKDEDLKVQVTMALLHR